MEDRRVKLKLLIIGESGVGKTSILQRFTDNKFSRAFTSTIGIDYRMKTITVKDKEVELQIWDTAGQERFFSITKSYYRGADGIFLVFDVANLESLKNITKWIASARQKSGEYVPIFLLGNKIDLISGDINANECVLAIKDYGKTIETKCFFTSAESGEKIDEAFRAMAEHILERREPTQSPVTETAEIYSPPNGGTKWCC